MKVKDLRGTIHILPFQGYRIDLNDTRPRSDGHKRCRALLKKIYPFDIVLEEVPVPGENLFLDFFIPLRKAVIEVQGAQHTEFVPFFHKSKTGFANSQKRDNRKKQWAEINNFKLIELSDSDGDDEWTKKILNA